MKIKRTTGDKVFDTINLIVWIIVLFLILYPLWLVIITSVSSAGAIHAGQGFIWPVDF